MVLVRSLNKKKLYLWHKRLGLSLGFILFLLGITGVLLTYRDELLPKVYAELMEVTPQPHRQSLVTLIQSADRYLMGKPFTHLYTAEQDNTAWMFFYKPDGAYLPHLLAINPYTGKIQGEMPLLQNIFGVALYLHANLLLGKTGSWIVGLMGLLLNFFFLSGIYLWWPQEGAVEKIKRLPKGGLRGLHRGLGIFLGLPLIFTGLTGFILAFDIAQPIGRLLGEEKKPEEKVELFACTLEEQVRALSLMTPEQQKNVVSVHFCSPKNGLMKFSFGHHERSGHDGYVRMVVDPRSQKVLQTFDTNKDPTGWSANTLLIYPMHTGAYFGGLGRIFILLCGLALGTLYVTGFLASLKRKYLFKS